MIQFILECIAFQLVFLIIYDFLLKRETFFQWNRAYLIGTYILSMVLPWIKIEALKTAVPEKYYVYPEFLWNSDVLAAVSPVNGQQFTLSWEGMVFCGGMLVTTLFFGYKLYQLWQLRRLGQVRRFPNFTRIIVTNSQMAFSFFRSIFLGDKVLEREHDQIIRHELVHIEQRHSWDLLFFELMRIIGWFNPLVYVYQSRVSELHEFIADAQVAKTDKKQQYEILLSQVFQTEHISFINQFFKSSLIKKRIVMLQKVKSKGIFRLKYLLLAPVIATILVYTSCQHESDAVIGNTINVEDIENLTETEEANLFASLSRLSGGTDDWQLFVKDQNSSMKFVRSDDGSHISGPNNEKIPAKLAIDSKLGEAINLSNSAANSENFKTAAAYSEQIGVKYNELLARRRSLSKNSVEDDIQIKKIDEQLRAMLEGSNWGGTSTWPYFLVQEVPVFPGCEDVSDKRACFNSKIFEHIKKNFSYTEDAINDGVEG